VEDSSLLRRGVPVAHSIFGTPQTINSANYVYFLALQELSTLQNPRVVQIFTEELINLHRGQGMDLYWRDTLTCPTEQEYLQMVSNKTGGLFRLAIRIMQAESSVLNSSSTEVPSGSIPRASYAEPATSRVHGLTSSAGPSSSASASASTRSSCIPLINTIGLLFQILDDLLNLQSSNYTAKKGLAEDLTEGKFSFPIIHAIRSDPTNQVLLNILRQKTTDQEVKRYAVEYMDKMGSFEYTRRVIQELERKALKEVGRLEANWGASPGYAGNGGERIKSILGKLKALEGSSRWVY
jgi:geranylgeranyl diphosphate synthase type 3